MVEENLVQRGYDGTTRTRVLATNVPERPGAMNSRITDRP